MFKSSAIRIVVKEDVTVVVCTYIVNQSEGLLFQPNVLWGVDISYYSLKD